MKLEINCSDIVVRPSSLDSFVSCPRQWALTFLAGNESMTAFRAAIGTAIHKGAEVAWNHAIDKGMKDGITLDDIIQASKDEYDNLHLADKISYGAGETKIIAEKDIIAGCKAFFEDIYFQVSIPEKVEAKLEVEVENPLISKVAGTLDYLSNSTVADLKTSKRKVSPSRYKLQQSVYKWLALQNDYDIKYSEIHCIVLNKNPYGDIYDCEIDVPVAVAIIKKLLETVEIAYKDIVPLDILFRANPKHYLCSEDYCAFYYDCPFTSSNSPF